MIEVEGTEALATTLEWVAKLIRSRMIDAVSLELTDGAGRLSVRLNTNAPPDLPITTPHVSIEKKEPSDP